MEKKFINLLVGYGVLSFSFLIIDYLRHADFLQYLGRFIIELSFSNWTILIMLSVWFSVFFDEK